MAVTTVLEAVCDVYGAERLWLTYASHFLKTNSEINQTNSELNETKSEFVLTLSDGFFF